MLRRHTQFIGEPAQGLIAAGGGAHLKEVALGPPLAVVEPGARCVERGVEGQRPSEAYGFFKEIFRM